MLGAFLRRPEIPNDSKASSAVESGRQDGGNPPVRENEKLHIGKISNFPIGENKNFEQHGIVVESFPEGLRVRSTRENGQFFALTTTPFGALQVDFAEFWPADLVYSIMTNEPAFLNTAGLNES